MTSRSDLTVTDEAMRPASACRQCFYCQEPVGGTHKSSCVLIRKRVKVRLIVEYEVDVPQEWDAGMVEFHRNESSWCADNALYELNDLFGDDEVCMCGSARFEWVGEAGGPFLAEK